MPTHQDERAIVLKYLRDRVRMGETLLREILEHLGPIEKQRFGDRIREFLGRVGA